MARKTYRLPSTDRHRWTHACYYIITMFSLNFVSGFTYVVRIQKCVEHKHWDEDYLRRGQIEIINFSNNWSLELPKKNGNSVCHNVAKMYILTHVGKSSSVFSVTYRSCFVEWTLDQLNATLWQIPWLNFSSLCFSVEVWFYLNWSSGNFKLKKSFLVSCTLIIYA